MVVKNCLNCKHEFEFKPYRAKTAKWCSVRCRTNETTSDGQGYLRYGGTKTRVHRKIMEDHLGRKLTYNEVVHHLNHDKQDNRLENLVVLTRAEHIKIHNPVPDWKKEIAKARIS